MGCSDVSAVRGLQKGCCDERARKFPRFFSEELRWLATYVALSRPPSLAQLISVGLPDELRNIIEAGPPEGILSRFNDMFEEKERATHIIAAEVMRELGWDATD